MKAFLGKHITKPKIKNNVNFERQLLNEWDKHKQDIVINNIMLGALSVWEILCDNYYVPYINSKTEEEKEKALQELLEKINLEYENLNLKRGKAGLNANLR